MASSSSFSASSSSGLGVLMEGSRAVPVGSTVTTMRWGSSAQDSDLRPQLR